MLILRHLVRSASAWQKRLAHHGSFRFPELKPVPVFVSIPSRSADSVALRFNFTLIAKFFPGCRTGTAAFIHFLPPLNQIINL